MNFDSTNEMFQLAVDLVNHSNRHIFLTGKAGTGKTTFLKFIRENCPKQMAVVAPTGVAAINAGGVTIHSFFQLPFSPFIPDGRGFNNQGEEVVNKHNLLNRLKLNSEKRKVLQRLELLVIDEVSMVRCDIVDAIDAVLRFIRKRPYDSFGGVQVLFIGDMFQLPPVIKEQEWKLLSTQYSGPFFFDSQIIQQEMPLCIEFRKIYRQSDEAFINVLNQVRNNELDEDGRRILDSRFQSSFRRHSGDGYILLTTHNESARNINSIELNKLEGKVFGYKAKITGDFFENAFPADEFLHLKVGAQVMFIKNDSDRAKRYFNGKIGFVSRLETDKIFVRCEDDTPEIEVVPEVWQNIRYNINKNTQELEEEELGAFTQYPLRLAWAITIHKSQGLTFEKAIIDAGQAFAAGQVYVALSRCTSLEGLVLQSRIRSAAMMTDPRIVRFSNLAISPNQLSLELSAARKQGSESLAITIFDFQEIVNTIEILNSYIVSHSGNFNDKAQEWASELVELGRTIDDTARKFHTWMRSQFDPVLSPGEIPPIVDRSNRAAIHFSKELDTILALLQHSPVESDSKEHSKAFNDLARELFTETRLKRHMLSGFEGKFDLVSWYQRKKEFILPSFTINAYSGARDSNADSAHPLLYRQLKKLRDSICERKDLPVFMVASAASLNELVTYLPQTPNELRKISGFGEARVRQYGDEFLAIIKDYCEEFELESMMHEQILTPRKGNHTVKEKEKKAKPSRAKTKEESLRLFREGKTVTEIAKERNLVAGTIGNHLSHFVSTGEIKIEELIEEEKWKAMEQVVRNFKGDTINALHLELNGKANYEEVRAALAWKTFQQSIRSGGLPDQ